MLKTLCLVLTLTIVDFAESSPINVGPLELDNVNSENYPDLGYELDENWAAVFSRLLGDPEKNPPSKYYAKSRQDSENTSAKTSGVNQKSKLTKGIHSTDSSGNLKSLFKEAAAHDQGTYDDDDESARTDLTAATAAVTKGKGTRTYARGTKTTGFHRVHHKDEYKKDQDFYEIDETKGKINSAGGKIAGVKASAGAGHSTGSFDHNREKDIYGQQGLLDIGFLDKQFSEFEDSDDLDGEFSNF